MKKSTCWIVAIILTLALSIYQRMTGPTYAKKVTVEQNGEQYQIKLPRSGVQKDEIVTLKGVPADYHTSLQEFKQPQMHYRRYQSADAYTTVDFSWKDESWKATLPVQPVAGKLEYYITVGGKDSRITKVGYYIRKYKLDELPQLWNVFIGEMSLVGPRPEVERYVNLYTPSQRVVLNHQPGITDYASIKFSDENVILGSAEDPEKMYIEEIMPKKIEYNLRYINNRTVKEYFKIIFLTFEKIIRH